MTRPLGFFKTELNFLVSIRANSELLPQSSELKWKKITFRLFMQECAIVLSLVEPLKASSNVFSLEN